MTSEILKRGKKYIVFLKGGFKYEGKLINFDSLFVQILDDKIQETVTIPISSINTIREDDTE
jgi:small nuclear ribonucleoprotein (snRNP)-like protein